MEWDSDSWPPGTVLVEFAGGPAAGQRLLLTCEDRMDPPRQLPVPVDPAEPDVTVVYWRRPHPADDGPLWIYDAVAE